MNKLILVLFLSFSSGCATLPSDFMGRGSSLLERFRSAYDAVCRDRDEAPECVEAREIFNEAAGAYNRLNEGLPE